MQRMRKGFSAGAVRGVPSCSFSARCVAAASDLAAISGRVHDSGGIPVVGALVIVVPSSPIMPERIALTDKDGAFSIVNLFAGQYTVKVSMPHFLSAMKQGIQLQCRRHRRADRESAERAGRGAARRCPGQIAVRRHRLDSSQFAFDPAGASPGGYSQKSEQAKTALRAGLQRLLPVVFEIRRDVLRYDGGRGFAVFGDDAAGSANRR